MPKRKRNLLNNPLLKWFMVHIISFYGCYTEQLIITNDQTNHKLLFPPTSLEAIMFGDLFSSDNNQKAISPEILNQRWICIMTVCQCCIISVVKACSLYLLFSLLLLFFFVMALYLCIILPDTGTSILNCFATRVLTQHWNTVVSGKSATSNEQ